jgi:hypothetical protein
MNSEYKKDLEVGHILECQVCGSTNLQQVIDMGFCAPCDSLLTSAKLKEAELSYPLNMVRCRDCGLPQIDYVVDGSVLFHPEYPYRSGITNPLRKNLLNVSKHLVGKVGLKPGSLVVDIGSNDGTILEGFKSEGMRVMGVEPTNIAKIAINDGIPTINKFFTTDVASEIVESCGKAVVVTAANVFAHVNQLKSLMDGVTELLEDGGYFISESHYMLDILETLQYDSIYHEHLRYYLIRPLQTLFNNYGYTLVDVERISNYGGSIRVYAQKGLNHAVRDSVRQLLDIELQQGAYEEETFKNFAVRILQARADLRSTLVRLQQEGQSVVGIGCPGRCVTMLNYCGVTPDLMPYIAEQSTSLKLGLFTPSTHIPVVDEERMLREQPDYAVVLSWHYADSIVRSLKEKGLKSKIVIPLPALRIL